MSSGGQPVAPYSSNAIMVMVVSLFKSIFKRYQNSENITGYKTFIVRNKPLEKVPEAVSTGVTLYLPVVPSQSIVSSVASTGTEPLASRMSTDRSYTVPGVMVCGAVIK